MDAGIPIRSLTCCATMPTPRSISDSIIRLIKQSVGDIVKKAGTFSTQIDAIQDSGISDAGAMLGDVTE